MISKDLSETDDFNLPAMDITQNSYIQVGFGGLPQKVELIFTIGRINIFKRIRKALWNFVFSVPLWFKKHPKATEDDSYNEKND